MTDSNTSRPPTHARPSATRTTGRLVHAPRRTLQMHTPRAKTTGASRAMADAAEPVTPERLSSVKPDTAPPALKPLKLARVAWGADNKNGAIPAAKTTAAVAA